MGRPRAGAQGGGSRPKDPPPWVGVGGAGGLVSTTRQICQCFRALIAGVRAACRCAVAYALRLWLGGFFSGLVAAAFLISSRLAGWRPPGAIFFLLRRRKNMERKTPHRAGWSPPYEPTPLGGCRWHGWVMF